MKNVLVLGGGGFIGRNIVSSLLEEKNCFVTAADVKKDSDWAEIESDPRKSIYFKYILADFSEGGSFQKLDSHYDEIYMLAALVGVNRTLKNPHEVIRVNTSLTMNLLDWVSRNSAKKILFASSSENYAGTSDIFGVEVPTDESVALCISDIKHPRWTYAMTKMHGESAFYHYASYAKFNCTIIRYQNIIGPRMGFNHAIPHIVERFCNHSEIPFKIYGHDQTRAFCFIDDAVSGTIKAMENQSSNDQIYHIGNDQEIDMSTLTKYIGDIMGYIGPYEEAETYPGSVSRRCPNINKAKNDLSYSPEIDWKDAVKKTVEWYKSYFESGKLPISGGFEPPDSVL
tara:strand:+ start:12524 stop:13549 length:1026 start_codon:yes stop_codon:yes gene_type:complete